MQLNRNYVFVVVFSLVLLGLAYANTSIAGRLFDPLDRGRGYTSLLAGLVPVVPIDGEVSFSVISSLVSGHDVPPSPGSLVIINSSGLAMGVYGGNPVFGVPQPMGSIDWSVDGPIVPGQSRSSPVVYLRNEGSTPVSLYFSTSGWVFRDLEGNVLIGDYQQFFFVTWDYDYSSLTVGEVRPVVFTLTISPSVADVSTFSFDLVVTLTG